MTKMSLNELHDYRIRYCANIETGEVFRYKEDRSAWFKVGVKFGVVHQDYATKSHTNKIYTPIANKDTA